MVFSLLNTKYICSIISEIEIVAKIRYTHTMALVMQRIRLKCSCDQ